MALRIRHGCSKQIVRGAFSRDEVSLQASCDSAGLDGEPPRPGGGAVQAAVVLRAVHRTPSVTIRLQLPPLAGGAEGLRELGGAEALAVTQALASGLVGRCRELEGRIAALEPAPAPPPPPPPVSAAVGGAAPAPAPPSGGEAAAGLRPAADGLPMENPSSGGSQGGAQLKRPASGLGKGVVATAKKRYA